MPASTDKLRALVDGTQCTVLAVILAAALVTTAHIAALRGSVDSITSRVNAEDKVVTTLTRYHYDQADNLVLHATFAQAVGEPLGAFIEHVNGEWAQLLKEMGL